MLSLSQGHCRPLGDDYEHVSATQENMEVVGSHETHTYFVEHIHNELLI